MTNELLDSMIQGDLLRSREHYFENDPQPIVIPAALGVPYTHQFDDGRTATVTIDLYASRIGVRDGVSAAERDAMLRQVAERSLAHLQQQAGEGAVLFSTEAAPVVQLLDGVSADGEAYRQWEALVGFAVPRSSWMVE